jgi:hypothetical protein
MTDLKIILESKPKVEDYQYKPYGYINALKNYIDKLEKAIAFNCLQLRHSSIKTMIKKIILAELGFFTGILVGNLIAEVDFGTSTLMFLTISVGYLFGVLQFHRKRNRCMSSCE